MTLNRLDIVNKALEYIDTPYTHQGRLKGVGVDCAGLIVEVAKELNLYKEGDITNYSRVPDGNNLLNIFRKYTIEKEYKNIKNGDIILMRFLDNPQHLGFYYNYNNNDYIIHSYSTVGKVLMHRIDSKWQKRIVKVFEFKEINEIENLKDNK